MANKRIKDLSTTAAVTASDDFIAVDGATNGTRKLDAYSPTFGGNLTVSGTGNSSFAGPLNVTASSLGTFTSSTANATSGEQAFTIKGSNNSTSTNFGSSRAPSLVLWNNSGAANSYAALVFQDGGGNAVAGVQGLFIDDATNHGALTFWSRAASGAYAEAGRFTGSGNLLIGTTTDSGNGKLQLATHTTSAGGIGFGTADSFYTAGVGDFRFKTTSAEAAVTLLSGGAYIGSVTAGKSTFIVSGSGATALTLDSSQRCILAGALRLNNAYTASAVVPTGYVTIQDSTGTTYKVCVLL